MSSKTEELEALEKKLGGGRVNRAQGPRAAAHWLFFASGALGLVYEVLWMRRFTLLLGGTAEPAAVALSSVFAGFAIGSWLVGPRAARGARPLRGYAVLEVAAGLAALLVEPLLARWEALSPALHALQGQSPGLVLFVKGCMAFVAVALPSVCLGATLPPLGAALASAKSGPGREAGKLYASNLAGAAGGALLVPFALLPALGLRGASLAASLGSIAIGAAAWMLDRRWPPCVPGEAGAPQAPAGSSFATAPGSSGPAIAASRAATGSGLRRGNGSLTVLAFASGAFTLGLEVLITRMFALAHENSLQAFAVVVSIFIAGLAVGAGIARALVARGARLRACAMLAMAAAGATATLMPRAFHAVSQWLESPGGSRGTGFVVALAFVTFPLCALAGSVLPLLLAEARDPAGRPARALGRILASNTLGCIAGSTLAAFAVAPWVGLWRAMAIFGGAAAATAAAVALPWNRPLRSLGGLAAAVVLLGAFLFAVDPGNLPRTRVLASRGEKLVCLREGSYGTVAVIEHGGTTEVRLNDTYTLGGTASTGDERLQGHLPLLLHPAPRRVAFLGLGTGITAGAAIIHPVEEIVAVELVPEVIHAATDHFAEANLRLAADPRVRIVADDARSYLASAGKRFDVIVGDLVVPWRPGESALYTLEHFESARRSLEPGGIFCQWIPLFQLSEGGFAIAARTFLEVFPAATLWRGDFFADQPVLALIGCADVKPIDPARVAARWSLIRARLDATTPYLEDPAGIWLYLVGAIDAKLPRFAGAKLNRDERPWIELLSHGAARGGRPAAAYGALIDALYDEAYFPAGGPGILGLLGESERHAREAGRLLLRASSLRLQGKKDEAFSLGVTTLSTLPEALQEAVLGRVVGRPGAQQGAAK